GLSPSTGPEGFPPGDAKPVAQNRQHAIELQRRRNQPAAQPGTARQPAQALVPDNRGLAACGQPVPHPRTRQETISQAGDLLRQGPGPAYLLRGAGADPSGSEAASLPPR